MVNGIINVYKEKGYTSFDVVAKLRGIFHQKKIGHTGTLDPDAQGVLPVCLGKATRVCDLLTDKDKVYKAVLLLGQETDTQDISGQVLNQAEVNVAEQAVYDAISQFIGRQKQVPPMYSALKVNGKKLYELAREGKVIERKARDIEVFDIKVESIDLPEVTMTVHCSKGTYIRTLCNDIGERLGCHGCMKSLLRVRVAGFDLEHALTLSQIQSKVDEGCFDMVMPVDGVFENLPAVHTASDADKLVRNGNKIPAVLTDYLKHSADSDIRYRVYNHRGHICRCVFVSDETGEFKPVKIFMNRIVYRYYGIYKQNRFSCQGSRPSSRLESLTGFTGHEFLMEKQIEQSNLHGYKRIIFFTFDILPNQVLGGVESKVIITNDEKEYVFEKSGIDYLIECPFNATGDDDGGGCVCQMDS